MHIDISRASFDPDKHFTGVIPLQGRVLLDADVREQAALLLHQLRTTVADLVGPAACPPDPAAGFAVARISTGGRSDLSITAGRMYVDGILVENPSDTSVYGQPDGYRDPDVDPLPSDVACAVYLQVWERAVTSLQDPSIREIALGEHGPDTTARSQVAWQVEVVAFGDDEQSPGPDPGSDGAAAAVAAWLAGRYGPRGRLAARAVHPPEDADVCSTGPASGFRGPENQLYRVEIHRGGTAAGPGDEPGEDTATFVWSRENGSVAFGVTAVAGAEVTLEDLGRDGKQGLEIGDRVQLVDDAVAAVAAADAGPPVPLFEVRSIDVDSRSVTLDRDPTGEPAVAAAGSNQLLHPLLRRWDHHTDVPAVAVPVIADTWTTLEDGIEVFLPAAENQDQPRYRPGDHWLIPARVVTGNVVWPHDGGTPRAIEPHGVTYHYSTLAYVPADDGAEVFDLRRRMPT